MAEQNGSSPLTRGKLRDLRKDVQMAGLIPAHAGKTASSRRLTAATAAHPRSRGENETQAANASVDAGSSPLTRGKLTPVDLGDVAEGLIPAHAGKTTVARTWPPPPPAHPRSRGENRDA